VVTEATGHFTQAPRSQTTQSNVRPSASHRKNHLNPSYLPSDFLPNRHNPCPHLSSSCSSPSLPGEIGSQFFRNTLAEFPLSEPDWYPSLITNGHSALQLFFGRIGEAETLLCYGIPIGIKASRALDFLKTFELFVGWIGFTNAFTCCWVEDLSFELVELSLTVSIDPKDVAYRMEPSVADRQI